LAKQAPFRVARMGLFLEIRILGCTSTVPTPNLLHHLSAKVIETRFIPSRAGHHLAFRCFAYRLPRKMNPDLASDGFEIISSRHTTLPRPPQPKLGIFYWLGFC
jgi:hypothetical protein